MIPHFHGLPSEDALAFMREFYNVIATFPLNGVPELKLRMRCIPLALKDRAKIWFMNLPEGSIRTWEDVYKKFITKYYSQGKTMELRTKISTFCQNDGELFHEAWDRFQGYLTQCPHHQYPTNLLVAFFYDGLSDNGQNLVDTHVGIGIGENTSEEMWNIFEMLATNSQMKAGRNRRNRVHDQSSSEVLNHVADLTKHVKMLLARESSHQGASTNQNMEVTNYVGGYDNHQSQDDPFSITYNPGWRNHPNFAWRDPNQPSQPSHAAPPGFLPRQQYQPPQQ